MKTDDMISMLAANVAPVRSGGLGRRYSAALAPGVLGSAILMLWIFGLRPNLLALMTTPLFWAKFAFPTAIAVGALMVAIRLSRPGMSPGPGRHIITAALGLVWAAAAILLSTTQPDEVLPMILGISWRRCPFNITLLSVPTFFAAFWAMKGWAPTRPRLAGAAAGLLASGLATMVYCLHCPEMSPAFWAIWYALGMFIPAVLGALLGPKLLRW